MMEKLGAPQTHLGLKNMIKEVDEDFDGKLSFREVRDTFKLFSYRQTEQQLHMILKVGRYVSCSDLLSHPDLYFCQ